MSVCYLCGKVASLLGLKMEKLSAGVFYGDVPIRSFLKEEKTKSRSGSLVPVCAGLKDGVYGVP